MIKLAEARDTHYYYCPAINDYLVHGTIATEFTAKRGRPFQTWEVPGWKIARRLKDLEQRGAAGRRLPLSRSSRPRTSGNSGYIGLPGCGHSRGH